MDQPEEHEENARNTFFEQLLTVRMPTAGPATQSPSSQNAIADLDTAKQTAPPIPIGQIPIEQMPTARVQATHPPVIVADAHLPGEAGQPSAPRMTGAPAAAIEMPTIVAPPPAPPDGVKAPSRPHRRRRIAVVVAVLLVVVVLTPVLYQLSSSHLQRTNHTSGFAQGANPPPGWHPQDWAPLARQQAELNYVNQLIAHMTLDQEIGQMIMLGFLDTQMSPTLAYTIKQFHLGSVVLYAWNITGADQVKQLTAQMQSQADLPLFVATDQEGGSVNRLQAVDGPLPGAWAMGANGATAYAQQRGEYDAQQLYNLGINVNFAPVVDVANTSGGDLGGRTFGTTADQVTRLAGAYLNGLQSSGHVVGTLKHFPGLGDVPTDPHASLYTLDRSKTDLERIDWAPYKALIATGQVQMIMSTHVVLSAIDPTRPASLSEPVLTGILRDELGYQGVIVTDGIYMGALTSHYSFDQIILDSVKAGNDIICSTYSIASTAETVRVLKDAVQSGDISKSRIDDSVRRILLLKLHDGVLTMPESQG
ncbi:MAG TPA: glycoside hydrolase family 3 N-terminal domain-containing protein [Ktedonobacterales bacterium]|nr:glycoside hydrolase family 3 N-terminal domain-containing protein [Ktedonobacterales bacterium]